jgi:hypothetical protein
VLTDLKTVTFGDRGGSALLSRRVEMAIHIQVRDCLDAFPVDCDENSAIQDELGRFRVWAGNIAAHRPSHSRRSLEYRLRDSSRLRDTVLSLLRDLKNALDDLRGSLMADSRLDSVPVDTEAFSRHQPAREALDNDDDGQGENWNDIEDTFDLSDEESTEDVTHTQQAIDEVHDVITCLLRFSIALRNPGRNNQRKNDPDGQEIAQSFVARYSNHVREKFPAAPEYLVDRLGKSMSKHRQYFRYRKSHNEKLWEDLVDIDGDDAWERPSTVATSLFVTDTPRSCIEQFDFEIESNYTATSYEGSSTGDTRLEIPEWPADAQEGSPFECPLCFGILEAETKTSWRHHVFEDIPPYVCTSEACGSAIKSFSRRHEWARHEIEMHTKVWLCPYGCTEPIGSSRDFESHVRTTHHLAYPADASAMRNLTAACGRAESREGARSCPLCMKPCDSVKRWTKHVGHHLEQLALFSLPMDLLSGDTPDGSDGRSDIGSNVDGDTIGIQSQTTAYINTEHTFLELDPPPARGTSDQSIAIDAVRSEGSNSPLLTSLGTDAAKAELDDLRAIVRKQAEELANIRAQDGNMHAPAPNPDMLKAPVKFTDAVGRKFSFPWHLCKTWKGMEVLIKKAFQHVDVLSAHVHEGHYDLIGPEGEIIFPQLWDRMIKPDWDVTMHMWPIPDKKEKKNETPDEAFDAFMAHQSTKIGIGQVVDVPSAGRSRLLRRDTSQKPIKRNMSM